MSLREAIAQLLLITLPWAHSHTRESQERALMFAAHFAAGLALVAALLGAYALAVLRSSFLPNLVGATVLLVLGLHWIF